MILYYSWVENYGKIYQTCMDNLFFEMCCAHHTGLYFITKILLKLDSKIAQWNGV